MGRYRCPSVSLILPSRVGKYVGNAEKVGNVFVVHGIATPALVVVMMVLVMVVIAVMLVRGGDALAGFPLTATTDDAGRAVGRSTAVGKSRRCIVWHPRCGCRPRIGKIRLSVFSLPATVVRPLRSLRYWPPFRLQFRLQLLLHHCSNHC